MPHRKKKGKLRNLHIYIALSNLVFLKLQLLDLRFSIHFYLIIRLLKENQKQDVKGCLDSFVEMKIVRIPTKHLQ